MIVHIDFPIRIFNFPWKLQQVGFTLVRFSCIRYLSNKHCTALVAMPKWDLASETMIKTIKGEVVCCPCKLQAAVVSAMVSNTCPALTTEYTEYWTDRLLDQWLDFGKEFFSLKCPIEGKKVKHLSLSCFGGWCCGMHDGQYGHYWLVAYFHQLSLIFVSRLQRLQSSPTLSLSSAWSPPWWRKKSCYTKKHFGWCLNMHVKSMKLLVSNFRL